MIVEGLQGLVACAAQDSGRHRHKRRAFSESYLRDVERVMRELRRQGYLSLSDFSEGVADGWEKIEKIAALHKNVVFYHRHTKNQLMKFTSPYFYLHFRGDETPILNTCRAHGF